MKRASFVLLLATAVIGTTVPSGAQTPKPDQRPGVAVFPLFNGGSYGAKKEDLANLTIGLQQSLIFELSANSALRVVDRSDIKKLLDEQDLATQGRVDPATAAKIGKIVGAKYAVIGSFIDLNGELQLNARIVDVQTSEVVKSAQVSGDKKKLFSLLTNVAGQVTTGAKLPELPATVREARAKREIPPEAALRLGAALSYRDDGGDPKKFDQLWGQLQKDFPEVDEFKQSLKQGRGGQH